MDKIKAQRTLSDHHISEMSSQDNVMRIWEHCFSAKTLIWHYGMKRFMCSCRDVPLEMCLAVCGVSVSQR